MVVEREQAGEDVARCAGNDRLYRFDGLRVLVLQQLAYYWVVDQVLKAFLIISISLVCCLYHNNLKMSTTNFAWPFHLSGRRPGWIRR